MENNRQKSSSRIFLIGYMAAGKSTIGQALAEALGYDFLDTDTAIEELKGKSISSIFKENGEASFRQEEQKILKLATTLDRMVIATGGGLPMVVSNLDTMRQSGTTIFIETSLTLLIERISKNNNRPKHSDKQQLETQVKELYKKRYPIYKQAHHTISGDATVDEITKTIQQCLNLD